MKCKDAIKNISKHLDMYIQPIFNSDDLKVIGGEALIRFKGSKTNSAVQVIELIEKNNLEIELDCFVINTVCDYINKYHNIEGIICVNLNKMTLESKNDALQMILTMEDPDKINKLVFELNENTDFTNETVRQNIDLITSKGFKLAIDDFGIHDISLFNVINHKIDILKIDRAIMEELSNKKMKSMYRIVNILKQLDVEIIIEGIEGKHQLDFARNIGKCKLQGFLLGKPLKFDNYIKLYL